MLCACFAIDDHRLWGEQRALEEAQSAVIEAKSLLTSRDKNKIDQLIKKAVHLSYKAIKESESCSELRTKGLTTATEAESVSYQLEILIEDDPKRLFNIYQKHKSNDTNFSTLILLDGDYSPCGLHGAGSVRLGPLYRSALSEYKASTAILSSKYGKLSSRNFDGAVLQAQNQKYESERRAKWDQLDTNEKAQAAGHNREIQNCVNTALASNKDADNISNAVSDTTFLCSNALRL